MAKNLRQIPIICSGHTRPVVDLCFSDITPYSYFIISACKDGLPMIREGDTGDWVGTLMGHKGAVWGATINKEATRAATGAADFTAKIWDAKTGVEIHSFSHRHIVKSVDFSSNTNLLVTGCNDKNLRLFDLENYSTEPNIFSGHASNIKKCILTNDSKKMISISDDKTLRIWDTVSNSQITQFNFDNMPTCIEQSRDGQMLILSHGNTVELYDLNKLEKVKFYAIPSVISAVSISPDKSLFVCGSENFTLFKYSVDTGTEIESFKGHFGPVHCIQFSPDGEVYASGSEDGTLRLWQNTIGKTYGLWKLIDSEETNNLNTVFPG